MAPGVSRRWGLSWVESNLSTPQPDVNETLLFYFFSLLTLSLAVSSTAAHGWNESFMPVVHRPTHILTLPGSHAASVSIQATASMHIYIYWKKQCLDVAYYTSAPPPLGFCQPVVYFLLSPLRLSVSVCVCVSVCLSVSSPPSRSGRPTFQHFQWCASEICFQGNRSTKYSPSGFSLVRPLFTLFISLLGCRLH